MPPRNPTSLLLAAALRRGDARAVDAIAAAVRRCTGRLTAAARELGVPYRTLAAWRRRYPDLAAAIDDARATHGDPLTLARVWWAARHRPPAQAQSPAHDAARAPGDTDTPEPSGASQAVLPPAAGTTADRA